MRQIKLTPLNRHGSNRVRQHGNIYDIIDEREDVFILQSLRATFNEGDGKFSKDVRQIYKRNEKDFTFVILPGGPRP